MNGILVTAALLASIVYLAKDELTEEDEEPEELTAKFQQKPSIDLFDDLSLVELAASTFWGVFLYFGIFDINTRTNELSQASGDLNAVRPSDWLKIKLGRKLSDKKLFPLNF